MRSWRAMGAILIAPFLLTAALAGGAEAQWVDPDQMEIPQLNKIKVPDPKRVQLKNGMVVYFLEDHEFPVVDVRAMIRVGSIYEPAAKVGLASITGTVMRTGGTRSIPGDDLDEKLESMGASVETSIGQTQGSATVSVLSEDLEEGLRILSDVLRNPAFPQEKLDLARKQVRTAIASRNDEMFPIMGRELSKLIYGPDHPYARHTEYATVDAITRDDLVAFHKEYVHPDRIIMTVYGDFKTGKVEKLLKSVFGTWKPSGKPLPKDPTVNPTEVKGIFVANKDKATNSAIVLGHEGMRNDDPDYAAMQIFHQVMGGGLAGRLFGEIRSRLGLAYATGSSAGASLHHPGAQIFYAITQSDSTAVTLSYLKKEVEKALAEPFTAEELQLGKDAILNSLVFSLSSKGAVLNRLASYEFYGYPRDFLQTYQKNVQALTAQQVLEAARRKIRYPDVATLIVGTEENFAGDLAQLGKYTSIDIAIPEPEGEEIPQATEADLKRGQEMMASAVKAMGGSALGKVKDFVLEETGTLSIQGMELQISSKTIRKGADCLRSEQKLPMGTMVQAVCGDNAWMDAMRGPQAMPAEVLDEYKTDQQRDLLNLLRNHGQLKIQALSGTVDVDGKSCRTLYIHSDDIKQWKVYIEKDSHLIARMDYRTKSFDGSPVLAQEIMGDYQKVGEIMWPHSRKILHDGEPLVALTTTTVKVNAGVDSGLFQMP